MQLRTDFTSTELNKAGSSFLYAFPLEKIKFIKDYLVRVTGYTDTPPFEGISPEGLAGMAMILEDAVSEIEMLFEMKDQGV